MTLSKEAMHSLIVLRDAVNDHFKDRQHLGLAPTIQKAVTALNLFCHYMVEEEEPREKIDYNDMNIDDLCILAETDAEALAALKDKVMAATGQTMITPAPKSPHPVVVDNFQHNALEYAKLVEHENAIKAAKLDAALQRQAAMYTDPLTDFSKELEEAEANEFADAAMENHFKGLRAIGMDRVIQQLPDDNVKKASKLMFDIAKGIQEISDSKRLKPTDHFAVFTEPECETPSDAFDDPPTALEQDQVPDINRVIKKNRRQCARQTWEAARKFHRRIEDNLEQSLKDVHKDNESLRRQAMELNQCFIDLITEKHKLINICDRQNDALNGLNETLFKHTNELRFTPQPIGDLGGRKHLFDIPKARNLGEAYSLVHGHGAYHDLVKEKFGTDLLSKIPADKFKEFETLIINNI